MEIKIRAATEKDFSEIFELIKKMANFAGGKIENSVEKMRAEKNFFGAVVAENEQKIVGIAIYFFAYFTWSGKNLFLDDLFVEKNFRGQKIGTKLLQKIFVIARQNHCAKVRWQVRKENKIAFNFYKKMGAEIDEKFCNCSLAAGKF